MTTDTLSRPFIPLRFMQMETRSYLGAPAAIFWTFVYPIVLFFILNTVFGGGASPSGQGLSYTDYLITGLAVMTILSTALFGFAAVLVDMRAQGNLRLLAAMPFEKAQFYAGFVASRIAILAVFLTAFLVVFSLASPDATPVAPARMLLVIGYLLAGALALIGLGLMITTLISKTATAQAVANIINIPVIFLSDLFLPAALFPAPLFALISHGPFYQFVTQLRAIYAGAAGPAEVAPAMAAMIAFGLALTFWAGRRARWHA